MLTPLTCVSMVKFVCTTVIHVQGNLLLIGRALVEHDATSNTTITSQALLSKRKFLRD